MRSLALRERDNERRAQCRLTILEHAHEVTGSVAATCRFFGISRTAFYRWTRRYEDEGLEGLKDRLSTSERSVKAQGESTSRRCDPELPQDRGGAHLGSCA